MYRPIYVYTERNGIRGAFFHGMHYAQNLDSKAGTGSILGAFGPRVPGLRLGLQLVTRGSQQIHSFPKGAKALKQSTWPKPEQ